MMGTLAQSPAGVIEQIELLRGLVTRSDYEPLLDTIIAGVRGIAAPA